MQHSLEFDVPENIPDEYRINYTSLGNFRVTPFVGACKEGDVIVEKVNLGIGKLISCGVGGEKKDIINLVVTNPVVLGAGESEFGLKFTDRQLALDLAKRIIEITHLRHAETMTWIDAIEKVIEGDEPEDSVRSMQALVKRMSMEFKNPAHVLRLGDAIKLHSKSGGFILYKQADCHDGSGKTYQAPVTTFRLEKPLDISKLPIVRVINSSLGPEAIIELNLKADLGQNIGLEFKGNIEIPYDIEVINGLFVALYNISQNSKVLSL